MIDIISELPTYHVMNRYLMVWSGLVGRRPGVLAAVLLGAHLLGSCGCAMVKCAAEERPPRKDYFEEERFAPAPGAKGYPVYITGSGEKPVLLLHELPGLTPGALGLARDLEKHRWKVYTPRLFGAFGQNSGMKGLVQTVSSGRFRILTCTDVGPIRRDVGNMLDQIAVRHPGEPITVIGNCLTGTVPLDMLVRPEVRTVVLCQPAMPFQIPGLERGKDVWPISAERLEAVLAALERDEEKRVIFVQYADDCVADVTRSAGMVRTLVGRKLGKQVHVIVAGSSEEEARRAYGASGTRVGLHPMAVRDPAGHSTITGACPCDRERFRDELFSLLGRGSD